LEKDMTVAEHQETSDHQSLGGGPLEPRAEQALSRPLTSVRLRWRWLTGAFLLGLLAGGLVTGPTGYEATAVLRLVQTGDDSLRVKQEGQTVETTAQSSAVLKQAVRGRGITVPDLASRLTVAWQADSDIVNVTVKSADPGSAMRQANAVAGALGKVAARQSADEVDEISRAGDDTLKTGKLRDKNAEIQRKTQLGAAIAAQQSDAVAKATAVQLAGPARRAEPTGLPRTVGAALGGFSLLALAAAAAMLLPFRRRRVRTLGDLASVVPGVPARSSRFAAGEVAGLVVESHSGDLVLLAMDGVDAAIPFGMDVVERIRARGVSATLSTEPDHDTQAQVPGGLSAPMTSIPGRPMVTGTRLSPIGRSVDLHPSASDVAVRVTLTTPDDAALATFDGQSHVLVAVLARSGQHRATEIREATSRLRYATPMVILSQ
jgi:hypothetical protein